MGNKDEFVEDPLAPVASLPKTRTTRVYATALSRLPSAQNIEVENETPVPGGRDPLRPVLIVDAPHAEDLPPVPLLPYPSGGVGSAVCALAGRNRVDTADFYRTFDRLHLFPWTYPAPANGTYGALDAWPTTQAAKVALGLLGSGVLSSRHVVCIGERVWAAFNGRDDFEWCRWYRVGEQPYTGEFALSVIPHPTKNRDAYQTPEHGVAVASFLQALAAESPADYTLPKDLSPEESDT